MTEELSIEVPADEKPTVEELMDSLTGWEELAIEESSDRSIADMAQNHQTVLTRAAAAVIVWRAQRAENPRAKFGPVLKDMMGRRGAEISAHFRRAEEDEGDGFGGDGEAGKDSGDSETVTSPSQASVSLPESLPASTPI